MFDLITVFELISTTDWLRIFLLYSHLVLCIFAISAVLKTDLALLRGRITKQELELTAKSISVLLLFLWASGIAIIYIDTGFQPNVLISSPKLLLKLTCVCMLTLNGVLLHNISFPVLANPLDRISKSESILLVTTGALSTSHWLLAAFVGMSKPLARLPFQTLFGTYCLFVMAVLLSSLLFIPLISRINPIPMADAV